MPITNNAVQFLRGSQASLTSLIKSNGGTNGTFYLTEDSHRMYMGLADGVIVPVNDSIISVANVASLPTTGIYGTAEIGAFYYATAENILCIYNGTKWVQINPDTDTARLDTVTAATTLADNDANQVTVTTTLTEKETDNSETKVNTNFVLVGENGVSVQVENDKIIIRADGAELNYELNVENVTNGAKINLFQNDTTNKGSVSIVSGNDDTNVAVSGTTVTVTANTVASLSAGNAAEGFTIGAKKQDGSNLTNVSINPVISYGDSNDESAKFVNGTAALNVYSKSDIDSRLKSANAMQYKGTISTLPTLADDIQIGYTYKVVNESGIIYTDKAGESKTAAYGDLLIANSSALEDSEGNIVSGLYWDHVESGDESDTTYRGSAIENGMAIKDSDSATVASISVAQGKDIVVSDSAANDAQSNTITVAHRTINATNNPSSPIDGGKQTELTDKEIMVISGVTIDNGHITAVEYTKHTLVDSNATLTNNTYAVSAANNIATVTNSVVLTDAGNEATTKSASFTLKSANDNLTVTGSGTEVTVGLYWGTF